MRTSARSHHFFDTRSVLLFAALTVGTGVGMQVRAADHAPTAGPQARSASARSAFDRADSNRDGQLSASEAERLPAISARFEALDTNHDGMLSAEEFNAGAND